MAKLTHLTQLGLVLMLALVAIPAQGTPGNVTDLLFGPGTWTWNRDLLFLLTTDPAYPHPQRDYTANPTVDQMVYIPAGFFLMGNSGVGDDAKYGYANEYPQHRVYLSGYWIGKYDVTRGEYRQFIDAGGYSNSAYWSADGWAWRTRNAITQPYGWDAVQRWLMGWPRIQPDRLPVTVTYYEAEAYCRWAGAHLPTEAQWEKAARWDGHPRVYPWGDTWDPRKCNNFEGPDPVGDQTSPVGSYPAGASPYGCEGMAGNVGQWCKDWCDPNYYSQTPAGGWVNPQGPSSSHYAYGGYRVCRGSSWANGFGYGAFRCALRVCSFPSSGGEFGFRLAR